VSMIVSSETDPALPDPPLTSDAIIYRRLLRVKEADLKVLPRVVHRMVGVEALSEPTVHVICRGAAVADGCEQREA
jgi:hypothetical protein